MKTKIKEKLNTNFDNVSEINTNFSLCQDQSKNHLIKKIFELVLLALLIGAGSACAHASAINTKNVLSEINYYRKIRGLTPLEIDDRLNEAAEKKSNDMINRDYFEHYSFGRSPWDFIAEQNYNYLYAGENLAMDFQTSEGMVRAWMSSPTHRKNILNPDFDDVGIGVVKGEYSEDDQSHETIMVTNMFGKEKPKILIFFDKIVNTLKRIF